jgi:hypothetical protein
MYYANGALDSPTNSTNGTLFVNAKDDGTTIYQFWQDETSIGTRNSTDSGATWSEWQTSESRQAIVVDRYLGDGVTQEFTTSVSFMPGSVIVMLNGIALSTADYNASSGTSIVFTEIPENGDEITIQMLTGDTSEFINHNDLPGRDSLGAHPIDAIEGLNDALANKADITYVDSENAAQDTVIAGKEPSLGLGTAGQILATNQAADGKEWIEVPISLPDATGKAFNELATDGSAADAAEWSPFRMTPNTISSSYTIAVGSNATIGSFVLEDGNTITVEDGARLVVV